MRREDPAHRRRAALDVLLSEMPTHGAETYREEKERERNIINPKYGAGLEARFAKSGSRYDLR
jgi:hypothetical protein